MLVTAADKDSAAIHLVTGTHLDDICEGTMMHLILLMIPLIT